MPKKTYSAPTLSNSSHAVLTFSITVSVPALTREDLGEALYSLTGQLREIVEDEDSEVMIDSLCSVTLPTGSTHPLRTVLDGCDTTPKKRKKAVESTPDFGGPECGEDLLLLDDDEDEPGSLFD
jgi:hypothetical protein